MALLFGRNMYFGSSLQTGNGMNPYQYSQRWKFLLLIFAAIIAAASLWYTNFLVENLSASERTRAEVWAISTQNIYAMPDINDELITYIYQVRDSLAVPAIITDEKDSIIYWKGLDTTRTNIKIDEGMQFPGTIPPR